MVYWYKMCFFEVFMNQTTPKSYPVDYSSILYLSLMRKEHANSYRFTMTMDAPVCPDTLQEAVNRVHPRFPTIFAGFRPGFFQFTQVHADTPPQVQCDPGMVHTMTARELRECPFRVIYDGCDLSVEIFHGLTDGYGAICCLTTLVGEYLRLQCGADIPATAPLVDISQDPLPEEAEDSYPRYMQAPPIHLPSRYAYQLPGPRPSPTGIRTCTYTAETEAVLNAARRMGVSITALIGTVMAASVMEIQKKHEGQYRAPARIMVPIDLRRQFPSKTLRNFILYALPTLEPEDAEKPIAELAASFTRQMKEQSDPALLASVMAYNVKTQRNPLFRAVPLKLKSFFFRTVYRFFGESNSSITVTNLGNIQLPEAMQQHVKDIRVYLTPRTRSPYNCGILAYGGKLHIIISRYSEEPELETVFIRNMENILQGEA